MRYLIIFIITFSSLNIIAQEKENNQSFKKNQISIGYINISNLSTLNYLGMGYKRAISPNGAIRVTSFISYVDDTRLYLNGNIDYVTLSLKGKLGYEFRLNFNKWMLYYGVDIFGYYSTGKTTANYSLEEDNIEPRYFERKSTTLGINPFIGFLYYFNENISISTEVVYEISKTERIFINKQNTEYSNTETIFKNQVSPLGIVSLNFHF